MTDTERTPQGTARINSERFDTELAAVWYAANYYYETSFRRHREYIGVVFREPGERYGLTVRGDGGFHQSKVRIGDVPAGSIPMAVWHTHLPSSAASDSLGGQLLMFILSSFDLGWDEFSTEDMTLSDNASKVSLARWGHRIPIYLITGTQIKRYRGRNIPDKVWSKALPAHMARTMKR